MEHIMNCCPLALFRMRLLNVTIFTAWQDKRGVYEIRTQRRIMTIL